MTIELPAPAGVRALTRGPAPAEAAVAMGHRLPPGGLAARRMGDRFSLAAPTWRLLDSRVLAAAAEILDADVLTPLATWLGRAEQVVRAAETTLTDPRTPELTEVVLPARPFTHAEGLSTAVRVDGREVVSFRFRLDVSAALGEVALLVRLGGVHEVVCDVVTVSATVSLEGWPEPLWKPDPVGLPDVRVTLRPPVPVPLLPVPRARAAAPDHTPTG